MLNAVDLRIKLTPASDAFCLSAARNSTYRLKILGASLFVKTHRLPSREIGPRSSLTQRERSLSPLPRQRENIFHP